MAGDDDTHREKLDDSNEEIEVFSTAADNQTSVEVHVLQGERSMAETTERLGDSTLKSLLHRAASPRLR